jgi:hypothetical protein
VLRKGEQFLLQNVTDTVHGSNVEHELGLTVIVTLDLPTFSFSGVPIIN